MDATADGRHARAASERRLLEVTSLKMIAGFLGVALLSGPPQQASTSDSIPYPRDYRSWVHVKTALIGPRSSFFETAGGIHHIYANATAMEGYQAGTFADGSILVFDLLEVHETEDATVEGARQRIDVMRKDARRFSATGGWAFERFLGDSQTVRPMTEAHRARCFGCHEQRRAQDFVFSAYRR